MAYSKVEMIVGYEGKRRAPSFIGYARNERGIALVIALGVMVLLTILGAWVLNTASTDLRIAGNVRNYQIAFYNAEAGLEYAKSIGQLSATYDQSLYSALPHGWDIGSAGGNSKFWTRVALPTTTGPNTKTEANWEDASGGRFKGLFYVINSTGTNNNASVVLQAGVQSVAGN
jgi:Tfp pilus assembly protein PilX